MVSSHLSPSLINCDTAKERSVDKAYINRMHGRQCYAGSVSVMANEQPRHPLPTSIGPLMRMCSVTLQAQHLHCFCPPRNDLVGRKNSWLATRVRRIKLRAVYQRSTVVAPENQNNAHNARGHWACRHPGFRGASPGTTGNERSDLISPVHYLHLLSSAGRRRGSVEAPLLCVSRNTRYCRPVAREHSERKWHLVQASAPTSLAMSYTGETKTMLA